MLITNTKYFFFVSFFYLFFFFNSTEWHSRTFFCFNIFFLLFSLDQFVELRERHVWHLDALVPDDVCHLAEVAQHLHELGPQVLGSLLPLALGQVAEQKRREFVTQPLDGFWKKHGNTDLVIGARELKTIWGRLTRDLD